MKGTRLVVFIPEFKWNILIGEIFRLFRINENLPINKLKYSTV